MYLHLGSSIAVPIKDIIGIFDIDNATTEKTTRAYLKSAEEEGMVITVGDDLPKSLVVCCPKGRTPPCGFGPGKRKNGRSARPTVPPGHPCEARKGIGGWKFPRSPPPLH